MQGQAGQPSASDLSLQFQAAQNQASQCMLAMAQQHRMLEANNKNLQEQVKKLQADLETVMTRLEKYEKPTTKTSSTNQK